MTVLLAVHNGRPYIEEAIESVLDQTYRDFELLVVDDASTDGTPDLLTGFADARIRLLRNERNLGQAASLNRGLQEARGEYVARLDADDCCRPKRLERQIEVLDAQPAVALVGSSLELVTDSGRRIGRMQAQMADRAEFLFDTLRSRVLIAHPAAMFRRELVIALGGYDEATAPAEDKDLWRRIALAGGDARIVPEPLVVYRIHDAQLSQVQASYQKRVDEESQERFLRALSRNVPVRAARLLLAGERGFWQEFGTPAGTAAAVEGLRRLLEDAAPLLRLTDSEKAKLEHLVADQLLRVARAGWRSGSLRFWRSAPQLAGFRRSRPPAVFWLIYALAPLLHALWWTERRVAHAVAGAPPLRRLRAPGKQSRLLRLLYTRLVGGA